MNKDLHKAIEELISKLENELIVRLNEVSNNHKTMDAYDMAEKNGRVDQLNQDIEQLKSIVPKEKPTESDDMSNIISESKANGVCDNFERSNASRQFCKNCGINKRYITVSQMRDNGKEDDLF